MKIYVVYCYTGYDEPEVFTNAEEALKCVSEGYDMRVKIVEV